MTGAIAIAAQSALRSGAGLISVAAPDRCIDLIASYHPCYMTIPLPDLQSGHFLADSLPKLQAIANKFDAFAVGPGMGQSPDVAELVASLYRDQPQPMVVDADGLNALSSLDDWPMANGPRILTPHPGEFQRMSGASSADRQQQIAQAQSFAKTHNAIVVLKGHHTVLCDGHRLEVNESGTPAMAVGGSGDCLTGIILALLCQGLEPFDAARLATHVHGAAGELAHQRTRGPSVLATDIIECLPQILSAHIAGSN